MRKECLRLLMVFALVFTMIPSTAFAAIGDGDGGSADTQSSRWTNEERYIKTTYEVAHSPAGITMVTATTDHYEYWQVSRSGDGTEFFLYDIYKTLFEVYRLQSDGTYLKVEEKYCVNRDVICDIEALLGEDQIGIH